MRKALHAAALILMCSLTPACSAGSLGGMPDYCYVTSVSYDGVPRQYFELYAHRKYDSDFKMGIFESVDDASVAAGKLNCPFRFDKR